MGPGIVVAHRIAGFSRVLQSERKWIMPKCACQVVDRRFDSEGGSWRAGSAIGACLRFVRQYFIAVDPQIGAFVVTAEQNTDNSAQREGKHPVVH
jgi:hypothetical protein